MESTSRKVVIITGAGSGIGQATAVTFAEVGYNVVITGRTESKLKTTAHQLRQEGLTDNNILLNVGDITCPEDNTRTISQVVSKYGRIDTLVNNAGYTYMGGLEDHTLEMLDNMYKVHVRGIFDITKKAMPYLIETKGNVVNVSSIWGLRPGTIMLAYSMMKACLDHFNRAISVEYAPKGVRINSVNPAAVRTDVLDSHLTTEEAEKMFIAVGKTTPIGHYSLPQDPAKVIKFLASDDASFITGANIPVDGGWRNTMALPN